MECTFLYPNYQLFAATPNSDLADYAAELLAFIDRHGELLPMIDIDLDAYGLRKKARRVHQRQASKAASPASLFDIPEAEPSVAPRALETGRPRTPALVVFLFLLMRGRYGSVSDQDASERFCEYKTIEALLSPRGLRLPSRQTLVDNLNAVTNATRQAILDAQLQDCLTEKLDDFKEICIDSTAVCAQAPRLRWRGDLRASISVHRLGEAKAARLSPDNNAELPRDGTQVVPHDTALGLILPLIPGEVLTLIPAAAIHEIAVADNLMMLISVVHATQHTVHFASYAHLQLTRPLAIAWLCSPDVFFSVSGTRQPLTPIAGRCFLRPIVR
jgi:hypothetical protein